MLIVCIPTTTQLGETIEVRINGEKRSMTFNESTVTLDGTETRQIVSAIGDGDSLVTLICSDADGSDDFDLITP